MAPPLRVGIALIIVPILLVAMLLTAVDDQSLFALIVLVIAGVTFAWAILTSHR